MTIAVFNVSRATDASGHEIEPTYEYCSGIIRYISPYAPVDFASEFMSLFVSIVILVPLSAQLSLGTNKLHL